MIRSYCYKIQVNSRHRCAFEAAMTISNELYNAALEERISAWSKARKTISKFDQCKSLTVIRSENDLFKSYATTMLRTPLFQVDEAFKSFFSRVKKGVSPGFPRFRSIKRVRSFGFTEAGGWTLKQSKLSMKGLPNVRLKMHRPLEGKPVKLTVKRDNRGRWFAIICVKLLDVFGPTSQGAIGLDLGVENIATDSNGIVYGKISFDRKSSVKRTKIEHALARQRRGSKRWKASKQRLARIRQYEANARRTAHFQIASKIIKSGPQIIVIEKLQLKNMTRSAKGTLEKPGKNVAAKSGLNRSILDSGMAQFVKILTDKAESAGRLVISVDPRGTSQMCSSCDGIVRKKLSQRRHICPCGVNLHRDHNAALNVLHRA